MQPASLTAQNTARPAPDRAAAPRPLRSPQRRLNARRINTERTRAALRSTAVALAITLPSAVSVVLLAIIVAHLGHHAALSITETLAQAERMRGM